MDFVDRELSCAECGSTLLFSAEEQQLLRDKGFNYDPKRCNACKSKAHKGLRRIETRVKCSECGRDATVPFKLTGMRPVLCASCFRSNPKQAKSGIFLVKPVVRQDAG
jgi:CxxC-x17-CxxC domain-containing protein